MNNNNFGSVEFEDYYDEINFSDDNKIWNITSSKLFSDWMIQEALILKRSIIQYLDEGKNSQVLDNQNYSKKFIENLIFQVLELENFREAIFQTNGWKGRLGLELAKARLKEISEIENKIPLSKHRLVRGIEEAINKGYWIDFGIKSWDDLRKEIFGSSIFEARNNIGEEGFINAKQLFIEFEHKNKRLPNRDEEGFSWVIWKIRSGAWKEFGVSTWNDFLMRVFGRVNLYIGKYDGKSGLGKALSELIKFEEENERRPKSNDKEMRGIISALDQKKWSEFGIYVWSDLFAQAFGKPRLRRGKYNGFEGFKLARKVLEEFKTTNKRYPKCSDKGMRSIRAAAERGEWKKYGVIKWNDIFKKVFGKVQLEKGKYTGKMGLGVAMREIYEFYLKNSRLPKTNDEILKKGGIMGALCRGEWVDFGIRKCKWLDLKKLFIHEYNIEMESI